MAETTVREIEIRAKYESLAEMRQAIEMAKDTLDSLTEGTAEYEAALIDVKSAQDQYNKNLRVAVKENTAAKGSYNDLVNQLARLKEEWKNADPKSATFKNLTDQINTVKDQLGDMDHKIGNWQRNVGNYAQSFGEVLGRLPGILGTVGTATKALGATINGVMAANPVGMILTIATTLVSLVPKIMAATKALFENRDAMDADKRAAEELAARLDTLTTGMGNFEREFRKTLGESDEQLYQTERKQLEMNIKILQGIYQQRYNDWKKARKKERDEAEKEKDDAWNDLQDAQKALYQLDQQHTLSVKKAEADEKKRLEEEAKRKAEQRAKDAEARRKWEKDEAAQIAAADAEFEASEDAAYEAKRAKEEKRRAEETAAEVKKINDIKDANDRARQADAESWARYRSNIQAVASATASVLNEVAGAWQNQIQAQIAAGDISEAEGRRQFENVKALQYAVTWINTLSAVVSALAEPELPWVVKAANAAAALTTGIANSVKISNTELGSTQVSPATGAGVESAPRVSLTPQALEQYSRSTGATGEEVLNAQTKAGDVILVTSQLEAKQHRDGSIVREASF